MNKKAKCRLRILAFLLFLVPLGVMTKYYEGPGTVWVYNYGGGLLYVVFWSLLVFLVKPKLSKVKIAGAVFLVTSLLEVLQLYHPPFLKDVRSTFTGAALLGNSFSPLDFPHYAAGAFLAWLIMIVFDDRR